MFGSTTRRFFCAVGFLCFALGLTASPLRADTFERPSAGFKVSTPTGIPGRVLQPGAYTIRVVDHLADRYIVEVATTTGRNKTLFIGVLNNSSAPKGAIKWPTPANDATYLRGWNFGVQPATLEFAYPKNDAVALAKANNAHVPAVDPESEGMVATAGLSKSEMQIITLWLLSPTTVGPNDAGGIKAERLQQVASVTHRPVVTRLPKTGSLLPWFWLMGGLSLAGACGLGTLRVAAQRRA